MVRRLCILFVLAGCFVTAQAQSPHGHGKKGLSPADSAMSQTYRIYLPDGTPSSLDDLLKAVGEAEVVFIGEEHDDPVAHYLQATLLGRSFLRFGPHTVAARPLALSLEMFERDVQPILDEYLDSLITESHFLKSSRPWQNYQTDYKPMVVFAQAHGVPVIASNAPRRYVNRVSRLGSDSLDGLSDWSKTWLPPLPFPGPSAEYSDKWNALLASMAEEAAKQKEQAAKDTTVAHPTMVHSPADSLAKAAHPLPHDSPHALPAPDSTRHMVHSMGTHTLPSDTTQAEVQPPLHDDGYALEAQSLWDATMAHAISQHLTQNPNALVLHMVGSFHVEGGLGLPAQLEGYRPGTRKLVVVVESVEDLEAFDLEKHGSLGDFIILTDKKQPRTFEPTF